MPAGRPGITGRVTEVERPPGQERAPPARILVEESPGRGKTGGCSGGPAEKGCNKLYLWLTGETQILRETTDDGGAPARAGVADLRKGRTVRAWHGATVTRSYPGQTDARVILIESPPGAPGRAPG